MVRDMLFAWLAGLVLTLIVVSFLFLIVSCVSPKNWERQNVICDCNDSWSEVK